MLICVKRWSFSSSVFCSLFATKRENDWHKKWRWRRNKIKSEMNEMNWREERLDPADSPAHRDRKNKYGKQRAAEQWAHNVNFTRSEIAPVNRKPCVRPFYLAIYFSFGGLNKFRNAIRIKTIYFIWIWYCSRFPNYRLSRAGESERVRGKMAFRHCVCVCAHCAVRR